MSICTYSQSVQYYYLWVTWLPLALWSCLQCRAVPSGPPQRPPLPKHLAAQVGQRNRVDPGQKTRSPPSDVTKYVCYIVHTKCTAVSHTMTVAAGHCCSSVLYQLSPVSAVHKHVLHITYCRYTQLSPSPMRMQAYDDAKPHISHCIHTPIHTYIHMNASYTRVLATHKC